MSSVSIVFHSVTGTTKSIAAAISKGVSSVDGVAVSCVEIHGSDIVEGRFVNQTTLTTLDESDAIIFGSPTFMGCVSAQFKAMADATGDRWAEKTWSNKLAAGFTIGSNYSGDQLNTLQYLQIFANQHGMIWVGLDIPGNYDPQQRNRLGAQTGLVAHSLGGHIHEKDLETAHYLGARVADITQKLVAG